MADWKKFTQEINELLQLDSRLIAVKRLEHKEELKSIPGVETPKGGFTYCQLPYLVRKQGKTIAITQEDAAPLAENMQLKYRCTRIQGLAPADDKQIDMEANGFTGFWYDDVANAKAAVSAYHQPSPIEALVMSPLDEERFEPDYILVYASAGQMTLIMNGYQYYGYEPIQGGFSGEGSCADALPRCVATGKPSLCMPCLGERRFGLMDDSEVILALPADKLETTVKGLKQLKQNGLEYPMTHLEAGMDVSPIFEAMYPLQDD